MTAKCSVMRLQNSESHRRVFSPPGKESFHFILLWPGVPCPPLGPTFKEECVKTGKVQGRAARLVRGPETLLCVERREEQEVQLGEGAAEEERGSC